MTKRRGKVEDLEGWTCEGQLDLTAELDEPVDRPEEGGNERPA